MGDVRGWAEQRHRPLKEACRGAEQPGGSVAEWSKALDLGSSHFDGVGSNPTAAKLFCPRGQAGPPGHHVARLL